MRWIALAFPALFGCSHMSEFSISHSEFAPNGDVISTTTSSYRGKWSIVIEDGEVIQADSIEPIGPLPSIFDTPTNKGLLCGWCGAKVWTDGNCPTEDCIRNKETDSEQGPPLHS